MHVCIVQRCYATAWFTCNTCCRSHDRFLDDSDKESTHTFDVTFADIRETMMRNEWHQRCYKCKADEELKRF